MNRIPLVADAAAKLLLALEQYRVLFKKFVDSRLAPAAYEAMALCVDEIRRGKIALVSELTSEGIGFALAHGHLMDALWSSKLDELRCVRSLLSEHDELCQAHERAIARFEKACRAIAERHG